MSKAGLEFSCKTWRAFTRRLLSGCTALANATANELLPPPNGPVQVKQRWFVPESCSHMTSTTEPAVAWQM
ncbi:hypothetical protein Y043_5062 [Burkholderia pseudomallei MSHR2138]|nr:hypothetical protein Y043_5062 [Burkholderia pseudomallei MSHR2138]